MTNPNLAKLPEVHRTEIDGVPVFWSERPGRLTASLIFGVGQAHEHFLNTGITHLIEHLVMRPIRTERYENNASTDILHTSFEVSSNPQTVVKHLFELCNSVSTIDFSAANLEKNIISAEEKNSNGPSVVEWLPAKIWFGNTHFGLVDIAQVATKTVDEEQLRTWLKRYFHRNNAALVLSGPPPEGLRLPLPEGVRPQPFAAEPFEITTPSWTSIPNGLAGNALVEWTAEMGTAMAVLEARLTETLRHRDGLVYEIAGNHQMIGSRSALVGFGGDIPDQETAKAAEIVREILADLANVGPSEEELSIDRERFIEQLDEPEFVDYHTFDAAITELTNWPSVVEHHQKIIDGLRREDVAKAAKELIGKLVLCTPEESRVPGLPELPVTAVVPPVEGKPVKRALFSSVPKQYRLIVGDDGLTAYYGESAAPMAIVRYDDLAGVGIEEEKYHDEPILHLYAKHGGNIIIHPGEWRGGPKLVREIKKKLDPSLCFPAPDAMRMLEED